jgi:hypothetical protein
LREKQEGDDPGGRRENRPDHQLGRKWLERDDTAPLPVVLLELDDFLAEQGPFRWDVRARPNGLR